MAQPWWKSNTNDAESEESTDWQELRTEGMDMCTMDNSSIIDA